MHDCRAPPAWNGLPWKHSPHWCACHFPSSQLRLRHIEDQWYLPFVPRCNGAAFQSPHLWVGSINSESAVVAAGRALLSIRLITNFTALKSARQGWRGRSNYDWVAGLVSSVKCPKSLSYTLRRLSKPRLGPVADLCYGSHLSACNRRPSVISSDVAIWLMWHESQERQTKTKRKLRGNPRGKRQIWIGVMAPYKRHELSKKFYVKLTMLYIEVQWVVKDHLLKTVNSTYHSCEQKDRQTNT